MSIEVNSQLQYFFKIGENIELNAASKCCRRCRDVNAAGSWKCASCVQNFRLFNRRRPKEIEDSADVSSRAEAIGIADLRGGALEPSPVPSAANDSEDDWETENENEIQDSKMSRRVDAISNSNSSQTREGEITEDILSRIRCGQKTDQDISPVLQLVKLNAQKPVLTKVPTGHQQLKHSGASGSSWKYTAT